MRKDNNIRKISLPHNNSGIDCPKNSSITIFLKFFIKKNLLIFLYKKKKKKKNKKKKKKKKKKILKLEKKRKYMATVVKDAKVPDSRKFPIPNKVNNFKFKLLILDRCNYLTSHCFFITNNSHSISCFSFYTHFTRS